MRTKLKMNRKILTSALMVLFLVSTIPVLAEDMAEVELTVTVVTYLEDVPIGTTTIDASEEAGVMLEDFTCTESTTVTISLHEENPHPEAKVPTDSPMALGIYLEMESTVAEFETTIKVYYTDADVEAAGIDEETLRLYYFDTEWVQYAVTGVNTDENYVWAEVTHFTAFALFGSPPNQPPVADADGPYSGRTGRAIKFDGTWSRDPDGTIVKYEWNFGDGGTGMGSTPSHTYYSTGTYTATLKVTDDDGLTGSDTATVKVTKYKPSNKKPVADAGPDQTACVGETVDFSGAESYDPDGKIVSYKWDFGDGETASGVEVSHAYSDADTYKVTLTVKDNKGAKDTDKCVVTVTEVPPDMGILSVDTKPVKGEVFVDEVSWGIAPQSQEVEPGTYTVSFGDMTGYTTPSAEEAVVTADTTTNVKGTYVLAPVNEISLSVGWNLISLPVIPDDSSIEAVLEGLEGVESVWTYYADTWYSYSPGAPSDLTEMVDGKGYWIHMSATATLAVDEAAEPIDPFELPPYYPVTEGWNLIGFTETYEMKVEDYLKGVSYVRVYEYVDGYNSLSADEDMVPGRGYWIAVFEPGTIYP